MGTEIVTLVTLYGPLVLGGILVWCALRATDDGVSEVSLSPIGFVGLSVPVKQVVLKRVLFGLGALAAVSWYLFYDYTSFFPSTHALNIYLDRAGLEHALSEFTDEERQALGIVGDFQVAREAALVRLNEVVEQKTGARDFFANPVTTYGEGEVRYVVEPINGVQRYYLSTLTGSFEFVSEAATSSDQILMLFEKIPAQSDYIEPALPAVFWNGFLFQAYFKQTLAENYNHGQQHMDAIFVGATKLTLLPYPRVGTTVYFVEDEQGARIPFAYAHYQ